MKNLISMVDFLPEHTYSKFLKQPLELWMFVPCDKDGNILKKPFKVDYTSIKDTNCHCCDNSDYIYLKGEKIYYNNTLYSEDLRLYRQAKERCLFVWQKGFDYKIICEMFNDLEDIILFEFELTENAQKQIGL